MNIIGFSVQPPWLINIQPGESHLPKERGALLDLYVHTLPWNTETKVLAPPPKGPRDTSKVIPPLWAQVSSSCHSSMWDITQFLRFACFIFNGHHEI